MSRERESLDEIGKRLKTEIDASSSSLGLLQQQIGIRGHNNMLGPGPPGSLNTITPCAACKLLRRRCAEECPFSPYFSPHEPHKFAAVHKVFGASNVSKLLMEVPEGQRADASNSLVYEANVRLRDPVYGCMGAISALQQQVQALQAELNAVRAEILRYKYRELATNNIIASSNNNNNVAALVSSVSIADQLPQAPRTPPTHHHHGATPPPPPPPPVPPQRPQPSVVVVSSSSSPASSLYTQTSSSATSFNNNISNNNLPFF